jgi:hypothetical protein
VITEEATKRRGEERRGDIRQSKFKRKENTTPS